MPPYGGYVVYCILLAGSKQSTIILTGFNFFDLFTLVVAYIAKDDMVETRDKLDS